MLIFQSDFEDNFLNTILNFFLKISILEYHNIMWKIWNILVEEKRLKIGKEIHMLLPIRKSFLDTIRGTSVIVSLKSKNLLIYLYVTMSLFEHNLK